MEQFEAYFRRADLDQDGRISGAEAVGFLQGSNLSKQVLAQIWMHADQSHTGFLSREEFYNALKLVTVAQSKRELTPDIVKAAIHSPASAKIPPPQINLAAISAPQFSSASAAPAPRLNSAGAAPAPRLNSAGAAPAPQMGANAPVISQSLGFRGAPAPQMGAAAPLVSQNLGFRGQAPQSSSVNQQFIQSQSNQQMRPPLPMPAGAGAGAGTAVGPPQVVTNSNFPRGGSMVGPGLQNSNMSNDWLGGRSSGSSGSATMQSPTRGPSYPMPHAVSNPQDSFSATSLTTTKNPQALVGSGSRSALDSGFGTDMFSATQLTPKQQNASAASYSASSTPPSSALVPVSSGPPATAKPDPFEALHSTYSRQSPGSQLQRTPSLPKPNQQVSAQVTPSLSLSGMPAAVSTSSEQSQIPWPKMTRAGVQKYAKVFMEVDTDRDGRISGDQARNLFLSWRLPREVLKQVWDLSDQDNDSMLSLREFCIALYLMELYREGRPLPSSLPSSIMLDETLLSMAGPPAAAYGAVGWAPAPGLRPPQQGLPGSQPALTPAGIRPPMQQTMGLQADRSMQFNQETPRGSSLESSPANQFSNGKQSSADVTGQDAMLTEEKAESNEKVYMDSKEKLEFYRTKMQDLVLYKSRCDNRLNEITERAIADKREAEMLGKKYEEKYKQVAEIASKLTIEEASFREVQERKTELQQALTKMEQGGSADGILQVRADRIQSDLEELLKALAERCKKHGVDVKSTALIELPPGWQPGVPEIASVWDEEWDKFEDEGFSFVVVIPENSKLRSPQKESSSPTHSHSPDSVSNADTKSENTFNTRGSTFEAESVSNADAKSENTFNPGGSAFEAESAFLHSEDESKSPQGSPRRRDIFDSPTKEYSDNHKEYSENHFGNGFEADADAHRSFDEPSWGTFDNNDDDIDSVWGFNAKDSDNENRGEKYFFNSNNSGADSFRTDSAFQRSSAFTFEDSVPGSPMSRAGNSPRYSVGSGDPFDSFSRFDSFSMNDRASSPRRDTLTRFDSINSTAGFDNSQRYSFDDSDPFGSSGPFKVSSESQSSKRF